MNTPLNPVRLTLCWWKLICICGSLAATVTEGATLRLRAELPGSVPLFFPVSVKVVLENGGGEPVVVEDFPRPHLLRIDIHRVSTGALEYKGFVNLLGGQRESYIPPVTLAPGETSGFETVLAGRWGGEEGPMVPAFTSTGLFSLQFSYPVKYRENGKLQVEYARSVLSTLLVTNVPARHQGALEDVRRMPHLVWLMQPQAAELASPPELDAFEAGLRQHLNRHPNSPWASSAKFALASRLYGQFLRGGRKTQALAQEAINLLNEAQAEGRLDRQDVAQLRKRMDRVLAEERPPAKSKAVPPVIAQTVETQFKKLLEHMARGETNFITPLLLPAFRYNARFNASDWLAKLKREHEETSPFPMAIQFKVVSITGPGPEDVILLTSDVTFESGVRKSVRRVAATYRFVDKTWSLVAWDNMAGAER